MNKLYKSLSFFTTSILLVFIIYFGLSAHQMDKNLAKAKSKNISLENQMKELADKITLLNKNVSTIQEELKTAKEENQKLKKHYISCPQKTTTQSQTITPQEPQIVTKTITQTLTKKVEQKQVTVTIQNIGSFEVLLKPGDTAFSVLKRASEENGFHITYDTYSFGVFITSIGGIKPEKNQFWAFYYNGAFSNVGASDQEVKNKDNIFWQLANF